MNYTDAGYVYSITNKVNGKKYIGSTITLPRIRWNTHRSCLRRGVHHSYKLQSGWDKYGEESFSFEILLVCEPSSVLDYERMLIPTGRYNVLKAGQTLASKRWEGHTKKPKKAPVDLSTLRKNQWADPEMRGKRIAGLKKAASTPETKAKMSAASRGRLHSKITKDKIAKGKRVPVFCPELNVSFLSQQDAVEFFNSSKAAISKAATGSSKVRGKYALEQVRV